MTSDLDGSDRRRLTKTDYEYVLNVSPPWSPDGTRIAFVSDRTGRVSPFAVYTMAADGSDVRSVVPGVLAKPTTPVWSPDGRKLAFVALEPDSPEAQAKLEILHLLREGVKEVLDTVGADGSGLAKLGETAGSPSWSPDGGRIALARSDGDGHAAIVTTDPDGSNEKKVFESRERWSPQTSLTCPCRRTGRG